MANANQTFYPEAFQRQVSKPRAARFTGPVSQRKAKSRIEQAFLLRWDGPALEPEHRFHPTRKWRFDYAHKPSKVALEIEGAMWSGGRHTRPTGFAGDIEKYNAATALGWRVFRLCDLSDLDEAIRQIKTAITEAHHES
jgi:hypothetical protein